MSAPFALGMQYLQCAGALTELWLTRSGGVRHVVATAAARMAALVQYARRHSPYYRALYRGVRERPGPRELPIVTKRALMADFDEWATDRRVTRAAVDTFLADRANIGRLLFDRYAVWKSSGTRGEPGIFVHDQGALSVYDALVVSQLNQLQLAPRYAWGVLAEGGRAALVSATNDHYAGIANWRRGFGRGWTPARALSVTDPLATIVARLNAFQPALLASYPTMLALLGRERRAGRLSIAPATVWSGGERLSPHQKDAIERDFGAPLSNEYGASEALSIAYGCREGWLHVNAEWVLLEPVSRDGGATPPGELSDTVLLTNLANRVQPLIRYDLGDRIVVKSDACRCGNPLPAIRVDGRSDDVLRMKRADGRSVPLLPLVVATLVEEAADVHCFQVVQAAPDRLDVRLALEPGPPRDAAWRAIAAALTGYLAQDGLGNVAVELSDEPPRHDAASGKLRAVVAHADAAQHAAPGKDHTVYIAERGIDHVDEVRHLS